MIKINRFFIPYIVVIILIGFGYDFLIAFFWIFLHEISHFIVATNCGIEDIKLNIIPMGTYIESQRFDEAKPREDMIISLAGPIFNIAMSIILYQLNKYIPMEIFKKSFDANLILGIFNMLPAFPLDGARILRAILSRKTMYKRANKITVRCSLVTGVTLLGCFIFLWIFNRFNISLGLIALLIIVISFREKERIVYIIMGDIIRKKNRFMKDSYIENKSISVYYKKDLITLLGLVDKNKYNLFTILDDDMKIIDTINEHEVLEGLKSYGNLTIEEFTKMKKLWD